MIGNFWLTLALVFGIMAIIINLHTIELHLINIEKATQKIEERTRFMDLSLEILKP